MKVDKKYVINNEPVDLVAEFKGIRVFEKSDNDESGCLYFEVKGEIVQTMEISADCNQNVGFYSIGFAEGYSK